MRTITYQPLPCMGPDLPEASGSVLELLKEIPYFLRKRIPPRQVLNKLFSVGVFDAGMSGGARWEPFELSQSEYEELCAELSSRGHLLCEPPAWVVSQGDWLAWEMEIDQGIPAKEHRKLSKICEEIDQKMENAKADENWEEVDRLHIESIQAGTKLADFIDEHLKR